MQIRSELTHLEKQNGLISTSTIWGGIMLEIRILFKDHVCDFNGFIFSYYLNWNDVRKNQKSDLSYLNWVFFKPSTFYGPSSPIKKCWVFQWNSQFMTNSFLAHADL